MLESARRRKAILLEKRHRRYGRDVPPTPEPEPEPEPPGSVDLEARAGAWLEKSAAVGAAAPEPEPEPDGLGLGPRAGCASEACVETACSVGGESFWTFSKGRGAKGHFCPFQGQNQSGQQ